MDKRLIIIFGGIIITLLVVAIGLFAFNQYQQVQAQNAKITAHKKAVKLAKEKDANFTIDLATFLTDAAAAGSSAETIGNKYLSVWNKAIFNDNGVKINGVTFKDFSKALSEQQLVFTTNGAVDKVTNAEDSSKTDFDKLKKDVTTNNKDKLSQAQSLLDSLLKFDNVATTPTGSYTSYSESFNKYDTDVSTKLSAFH